SSKATGAIVFRFDANQKIGTGHAMRCASLSDRFEELGWNCFWAVTAETATFLGSSLPQNRAIVVSGDDVATQLAAIAARAGRAAAMILDHYSLPRDFDHAARRIADRIIWIDDFADRPLDADMVVNSTPGIDAATYQPLLPAGAKLLLGGAAAPLRRQFLAGRAAALQRGAAPLSIKRILVAFGGVDPLDGTSLAIAATVAQMPNAEITVVLGSRAPHLAQVRQLVETHQHAGAQIRLLLDVADMAGLMAQSDLCIGAPGTSTWERCCLGLPSLLVGIAENQRANADIMTRSGGAVGCGFLTTDSREQVAMTLTAAIEKLHQQPNLKQDLSRIAATLCDGRGIDRIVVANLPPLPLADGVQLALRLMEPADEAMLLTWQAAPETRRFATNPQIPSGAEHHAWFTAKLLAPADLPLIAEINGEAAGYVRLDWRGESRGAPVYLVSIATAPGHYRRGIGKGMLRLARQLAPGAILLAQILPGNTASIALFHQLGYELRPDGYYWSLPVS
ncbi:MAG TPA: UDP-2,4-diacetamido-2,4,6-trideoxy-beta-L-altropyranose hydrolase, partial [Dongiaceae bacterium]|nr:UDP-2,4-diacetamido-2,4,6-trideoxy-beta-L-altropyranose hydrolase [Dongiaceae bacterium]